MKHLKAVIFDVDGTLAETERDGHRTSFNRAFKKQDLDWFWDEHLYGELLAVTGGKERIKYYLKYFNTQFNIEGDLDKFVAVLHQSKTAHYVELLQDYAIELRPGVKRLIDEIRESDVLLAIATTTTHANVTELLTSTLGDEAESWFSCVSAADIVPAKKPAPDIFKHCLDTLGLKAEECIAIEDSGNGVKSSVGAGIKTIVTYNDYTKDEDFTGAIAVFDHLGDKNQPYKQRAGKMRRSNFLTLDDLKQLHGDE